MPKPLVRGGHVDEEAHDEGIKYEISSPPDAQQVGC